MDLIECHEQKHSNQCKKKKKKMFKLHGCAYRMFCMLILLFAQNYHLRLIKSWNTWSLRMHGKTACDHIPYLSHFPLQICTVLTQHSNSEGKSHTFQISFCSLPWLVKYIWVFPFFAGIMKSIIMTHLVLH